MEDTKFLQIEHEKEIAGLGETKSAKGEYQRKPTVLNLQWLAERARKVERIKQELESGTYYVDSKKIAKALLNLD